MKTSFRALHWLLFVVLISSLVVGLGVSAQEGEMDTSMGVALDSSVSGNVEFWHFWGSPLRRNAIRRVIAMCQAALPNITVEEVFKPFGEIWTANVAAVAAGSGMPDVIVSDRLQLPRDAADGIYQNLQPYIDEDQIDPAQFYPFTWEQTLYEGENYGLPHETDVRVLYYNKTLFEAAGLDPNDPPETWEELETAADALDVVAEDGTIARMGFLPLINVGYDIWAIANGHTWVQDGQPVMNAPEVAETLDWIKGWFDRYGGYDAVQSFRGTLGAAPNDAFMSGKVAMIADIAGYSSQINFYRPRIVMVEGENPVEFQWGMTNLPHAEDSEAASWSGGFSMSMPAGAENPEGAWELIKCLTSPEGQSSWARDTYATPSNLEAINDPVLMADPNWQFIVNAMDTSTSSTFVPGYPNYIEQLNQRQESVWRGDLTPEQAAQEAQETVDQTIADNS